MQRRACGVHENILGDQTMVSHSKPFIDLAPSAWPNAQSAAKLEWLSTNALGGYAFGTVSGALQRRWHGILIAATDPPAGRTMLVSKIEITAVTKGVRTQLSANQWVGGMDAPGLAFLSRVWLDGSIIVREWNMGASILEERIVMARGRNTTAIVLTLRGGNDAADLELKCMVNHRPHDQLVKPNAFTPRIQQHERGLHVCIDHANGEGKDIFLQADGATAVVDGAWYSNYFLPVEEACGYDCVDAHCCAGILKITLKPGESRGFTASTRVESDGEGARLMASTAARDQSLIALAKAESDSFRARLVLAADQFIVDRPLPNGSRGTSIIAGYPWFADWGRDALISLPGLCLETGRFEEAASILRSLAHFEKDGLLPNRFPSPGEPWLDNSVDAPLLLAHAARRTVNTSGDFSLASDLFPTLINIFNAFTKGTRHGIRVDPADGLLIATDPGTQLTWMDAKVGATVITPRMGKPVEINALWCGLLATLIEWAPKLKQDASEWIAALAKAQKSFVRYINANQDQLADTLDSPQGVDTLQRPNQLFAVQPLLQLIPTAVAQKMVARVEKDLLTPYGLRTLEKNSPGYVGRYGGRVQTRDQAYHNGTAWPWLIAPLGCALRTLGNSKRATEIQNQFQDHLRHGCLGQICEVADGDLPQNAGGCVAQAWSVAAMLDQGIGEPVPST